MPTNIVRTLLLCLVIPVGLGIAPSLVAAESPADVVGKLYATLLEVMKNADSLGYEGRYRTLEPVLKEVYNFPVMARVAVGRHWDELDETQRQQLVDAFARMSIATYASRFDGYSGEDFKIQTAREVPRGAVMVETQIIRPADEPVQINYLLRPFDEQWRIVDVLLEARYSELAVRRSEFTSVLEREGFDALISNLEEKIAQAQPS